VLIVFLAASAAALSSARAALRMFLMPFVTGRPTTKYTA
jgi:hypothetical protein